VGGGPYLTIFQDKAETPSDGFEWTKGISRISHPTEEQFGCGRYSRFPVHFVIIRGSTKFTTLAGVKSPWYMIRNDSGV